MEIIYHKASKCFYLQNEKISYVFKIENGILKHLYYGKRIFAKDDIDLGAQNYSHGVSLWDMPNTKPIESFGLELGSFGHRGDFRSSSLEIDNNGHKTSDFKYFSHSILSDKPRIDGMPSTDGEFSKTLKVVLVDKENKMEANLFYTIYEDSLAITRRMEVINCSKNDIKLKKVYSMNLDFTPKGDMQAITFNGAWLRERSQERVDITHNEICVSSNRGVFSAQANPSMILVEPSTTLDNGVAIGVNLIYSGDFAIKAKKDQYGKIRILAGINEDGFEWTLKPGEMFSTPEVALVYSMTGLNGMSESFHTLYRDHLIPEARTRRDVVCNNWEATGANFDEESLMKFIAHLKDTGVDTFVLDDGWFLKRNDDTTSLGDWIVDPKKLPHGLKYIIDYTHSMGLKFGLWFEPEMISRDSQLFKEHPDWALHSNTMPSKGRNQYVLDLTRDDVCKYVTGVMNKFLDEYDINYVKWDMNRYLTEDFSEHLGERSGEVHHRYVLGLYKIMESVVGRHGSVLFEGCASGGARFDAGMLAYFPQIWCSDNSDPVARAEIQANTSLFYPLSSISCHYAKEVSGITGRATSGIARFAVASMGVFGTELDFSKLSKEEKKELVDYIKFYKENYPDLILMGESYILSEMKDGIYAQQVVDTEQRLSAISILKRESQPVPEEKRIYPKGLKNIAVYEILVGTRLKKLGEAHGNTLMYAGIEVGSWPLRADDHSLEMKHEDNTAQVVLLKEKTNVPPLKGLRKV